MKKVVDVNEYKESIAIHLNNLADTFGENKIVLPACLLFLAGVLNLT